MPNAGQTTFHRRPALIPPDLHLSSEDEQSILLRIGNIHLASLGGQASSASRNSPHQLASARICATERPLIDVTTHAQSPTPSRGTKRKASTTAEQYRELTCAVDETLNSKSCQVKQHDTRGCSSSHTSPLNAAKRSNNTSMTQHNSPGGEGQSLSPKNDAEIAVHYCFFQPR
jgi:hypothetical protein